MGIAFDPSKDPADYFGLRDLHETYLFLRDKRERVTYLQLLDLYLDKDDGNNFLLLRNVGNWRFVHSTATLNVEPQASSYIRTLKLTTDVHFTYDVSPGNEGSQWLLFRAI